MISFNKLMVFSSALAIASQASLGHADKSELFDRYSGQAVNQKKFLIDDSFRKDWGSDPIICFNGTPSEIAKSLKFDNSASQSAQKRVRLSTTSDSLIVEAETKVCVKEEGSHDYVECVQYEDQFLKYEITSCSSQANNILYKPHAAQTATSKNVWIRSDGSWNYGRVRNIFPTITVETTLSGRNNLHVIFRLHSNGISTLDSNSGAVNDGFIFRGRDFSRLQRGEVFQPDPTRLCNLYHPVGSDLVLVRCPQADAFALPFSVFEGKGAQPRATSLAKGYGFISPNTGISLGLDGYSLREILQGLEIFSSTTVSGSAEAFFHDVQYLSESGAVPVTSYYESGSGRHFEVLLKSEPRRLEYHYKGACLKTAKGKPMYPGDDGEYCVQWETGLTRVLNF